MEKLHCLTASYERLSLAAPTGTRDRFTILRHGAEGAHLNRRHPASRDILGFLDSCLLLLLSCFWIGCAVGVQTVPSTVKPQEVHKVKLGIETLLEEQLAPIKGKRVGLVTNPTGVTSDLKSTIDVLFESEEIHLIALFGPEHGVRGDITAGGHVENYIDERTELPVYSLYGKTHKPTKEMLEDIDLLIYDIQDIGSRSYTYIYTMAYAMEAAAENNIKFMVLDRPNPLTGNRLEGNVLDTTFTSFVGMFPVPYVYGMTCGEFAQMINGEGWLHDGVKCDLTVIPMQGWRRDMWWEDTGLQWVPTSPHIPHASTALFYNATGIMGELRVINEGVGYTLPFEIVGAPWIDGQRLADELNAQHIIGVHFRPLYYKPYYFNPSNQEYSGVQIHLVDRDKVNLWSIQFYVMEALRKLYPEKDIFAIADSDRIKMFDRVNGTDKIRKMMMDGKTTRELLAGCESELEQFKKLREKYLIYR